mgnify:CR=1 FL=1
MIIFRETRVEIGLTHGFDWWSPFAQWVPLGVNYEPQVIIIGPLSVYYEILWGDVR